jgi:hypothetical protein
MKKRLQKKFLNNQPMTTFQPNTTAGLEEIKTIWNRTYTDGQNFTREIQAVGYTWKEEIPLPWGGFADVMERGDDRFLIAIENGGVRTLIYRCEKLDVTVDLVADGQQVFNKGEFFANIIKDLKNKDANVQINAFDALSKLRKVSGVQPLIEVFQDRNNTFEIREKVARVLGEIGDVRAVKPLITALEDEKDGFMRRTIMEVLAIIGDVSAAEPLIKILQTSRNLADRIGTIFALGKLGDKRAVEPIIAELKHENESPKFTSFHEGCSVELRQHAIRSLGELKDERALHLSKRHLMIQIPLFGKLQRMQF